VGRLGGPVVLVAAAILLLVLWMPKRDNVNGCIYRVPLGLGASYAFNCDSIHITRDARSISRYLEVASPSRSRPVHILSLAATAHVLAPVLQPLAGLVRPLKARAGELLVLFLAGVVLNVGVLALAHMAIVRLVGAGSEVAARAALMGLVASFDVTLAWFWIPHQVLMNVLVPLGGALAFAAGMRAPLLARGSVVLLGLATAAACLTYGYCLIWPVAFVLGRAWGAVVDRRWEPLAEARVLLPYAAAACLPIVVWLGFFAAAGREVAYEAQSFGQFAWMGEALRTGQLWSTALARGAELAVVMARYQGVGGWMIIVAAIGAAAHAARARPEARVATDPVVLGCLAAGALMLGFNYLQGYHQARQLLFPILVAQVVLLRSLVLAGKASLVAPVAAVVTVLQVAGGFMGPPTSME
jgi:hypothetical protein